MDESEMEEVVKDLHDAIRAYAQFCAGAMGMSAREIERELIETVEKTIDIEGIVEHVNDLKNQNK